MDTQISTFKLPQKLFEQMVYLKESNIFINILYWAHTNNACKKKQYNCVKSSEKKLGHKIKFVVNNILWKSY